jgi:hypothetical protein
MVVSSSVVARAPARFLLWRGLSFDLIVHIRGKGLQIGEAPTLAGERVLQRAAPKLASPAGARHRRKK